MYKTIQSALHKIKALQQGAEKSLKYVKEYKWIKMNKNKQQSR